ncbi:glycosyltransferase family 4 protein [Microbacterium xylanilyticum]
MRVLIASRIYRPEPSAASQFLGAVADALTENGDDVTVLTARAPRGMRDGKRVEQVRTFPVLRDREGYVRGYLPYLSFDVPLALRLLVAPRPDVVFVEPPPTTGAVVRVICALRRIPYVYDAADIWSDAAHMATSSTLVVRALRALERFALRGAAHRVTISAGVVARLRELGVDGPVTVTGFGADTTEFSYRPAPSGRTFVYAGSYSVWHGTEILIDAFADFSRSHPGYTLTFIGNGTERAVLEERARQHGVLDGITFLDAVPAPELLPHLSSAVASLATLRPGTAYAYAFATKTYSSLAAGCPVIFSGPGPTGPFLREADHHVRAGWACAYDAGRIAEAMRSAADDPATPQQREDLSRWTDRTHSLRAVARRVADVLHAAARRKRRNA